MINGEAVMTKNFMCSFIFFQNEKHLIIFYIAQPV